MRGGHRAVVEKRAAGGAAPTPGPAIPGSDTLSFDDDITGLRIRFHSLRLGGLGLSRQSSLIAHGMRVCVGQGTEK